MPFQKSDLQFFVHVMNLCAQFFVNRRLTFRLLLFVDQFDVNVAHLGTMVIDCHLYNAQPTYRFTVNG